MSVIRVNLGELSAYAQVLRRGSGDLRHSADITKRTLDTVVINRSDPSVHDLHGRLDRVIRDLRTVSTRLDDQAAGVSGFAQRVAHLDGMGGRTPLRLAVATRRHINPRQVAVDTVLALSGVTSLRLAWRGVGIARRVGTSLLRKVNGQIRTTERRIETTAVAAFSKYVLDPLRRIRSAGLTLWHRLTDPFTRAWDAAWAKYTSITRQLRDIGTKALRATFRTVKQAVKVVGMFAREVGHALAMVFTTRFTTVEGRPDAKLLREDEGSVDFKVKIPDPPIELSISGSVDAQFYDDNTVEVTIGEKFAAGLSASLAAQGVSGPKVEAAIQLALSLERTYRFPNTMIGGQPSYQVFVEQELARLVLTILWAQGGPAGIAAGLALKSLPPAPTPNSWKASVEISGEVEVALVVGGLGVKGKAELGVRTTVSSDRSTVIELDTSLTTGASAAAGGVTTGQESTISGKIQLHLDSTGMPDRFTMEVANQKRTSVGATSGPATGSSGTVTTITDTADFPISPADRAFVMSSLGKKPPDMAAVYHRLEQIAAGGQFHESTTQYDYSKASVTAGNDTVGATFSTEQKTNFRSSQ